MTISILLPYKENFSPKYAGAVSLFIKETLLNSEYKNQTTVYGFTKFSENFKLRYQNIDIKNKIFQSKSKTYLNEFIKYQNKTKSKLIEIHNRPLYVEYIHTKISSKIVFYFHNDPLTMNGSSTIRERLNLVKWCERIIFNSDWSYNQFLKKMNNQNFDKKKLIVIKQSASKKKIDIKKKEKVITFVGKLNKAKGYDVFGTSIIKILKKYKNWTANIIGDEVRESYNFIHPRLKNWGFQEHNKVLNIYKKTSISVTCSRWEEPFGRTSLEAAASGCAVIITNRGGLPETITNGIVLKNLSTNNLFKEIKNLIEDTKLRTNLQSKSIKNFYLTHKYAAKKIDIYRKDILKSPKIIKKGLTPKNLKILHVTNFNERHNGRLFYNSGKRINNGFIRLGHSVLEFSDRDIQSSFRTINDINGSRKLNIKFIETVKNFKPNIIVLGHADLISNESLDQIKKDNPDIRIAQWFLDRMDSHWKNNKHRFEKKFRYVDVSFCTTAPDIMNFPKQNKIYYMPNPVDQSLDSLKIFNNKKNENDVFFAMSHGVHRGVLKRGKHDIRQNFINKLINKTPNIKYDLHGVNSIQPIWSDNYLNAISKSKMGLNLSQGKSIKYYSSDRLSQMMGNGLLTFVDKNTQLNDFFTNKEIIFYHEINDLAEKILFYKKNDKIRLSIAKAGRGKYFKYFNSNIIARYIISKTLDLKNEKFYWE